LNTALVLDGTTLVPASTELAIITTLGTSLAENSAYYASPSTGLSFRPVLLYDDEMYFCYDHFVVGGGSNPFFTEVILQSPVFISLTFLVDNWLLFGITIASGGIWCITHERLL
jgi:hypothetical protein